jgi:hypothetical protein
VDREKKLGKTMGTRQKRTVGDVARVVGVPADERGRAAGSERGGGVGGCHMREKRLRERERSRERLRERDLGRG